MSGGMNGIGRSSWICDANSIFFKASSRASVISYTTPTWFTRRGFMFRVPEDDQVDLKKAPVGDGRLVQSTLPGPSWVIMRIVSGINLNQVKIRNQGMS